MKNKKLIYTLCAALLLVAGGIVGGCTMLLNRPLHTEKATYLYIDADDDIDSVCAHLQTRLKASSLSGFRMLARLGGLDEHLYTGAYRFEGDERTWNIFRRLQRGRQTPVRLTIPSVRTVSGLLKTVSRQLMTDSASIAALLGDSAYLDSLGYNAYTLPALFIPNTYEVYWNLTPEGFIRRMQREHERFWTAERKAQAERIGLTPQEVATLASIVEEETASRTEKPTVAGLYINRLHRGMLLQADPTVKFGLQDFGLRRILHKHLEQDTPYNTYKHPGLPPGPIRIPSIDGLKSVLNYTRHDYLYMCAKEDFSGRHNFARTLSEHSANARRYQQALNRRNIK